MDKNFGVSILDKTPILIRLFTMACFTWARMTRTSMRSMLQLARWFGTLQPAALLLVQLLLTIVEVYVGTWDAGNFYALNSSTGAELWDAKISHVRTTPAVDNGVVYVSSDDFYLHAFNASTGALLWRYLTVSLGDTYAQYNGMFASPAVAEGRVYIGTNEGNILAFGNQSSLPPPQTLSAFNIFLIVLGVLVALVVVVTVVVLLLKKRLAVKTTL